MRGTEAFERVEREEIGGGVHETKPLVHLETESGETAEDMLVRLGIPRAEIAHIFEVTVTWREPYAHFSHHHR